MRTSRTCRAGTVLVAVVLLGLGLSGWAATREKRAASDPNVAIERIDTARAWASPCWGYHTPKIVRNARGEIWAVNWFGEHGGRERARILKRGVDGTWRKGAEFDSLYQPSMIFLDTEGRLNYLQNSQTRPIRHYRSSDNENLRHFDLVATGNGIPDGRGWYVGSAVQGDTMFLGYVTLDYNFYYTWKRVIDTLWHPAILVEAGYVDTVFGNHSWLYPRFTFFGDKGYISVSSTVDGSKQNTYDKVCLVSFSLSSPEKFTKEVVYDGALGYYSYCYDTIVTPDSVIVCGFNAGRYKYGPRRTDILPPGLYAASRKVSEQSWSISRVDSGDGGLALHAGRDGMLWALVTLGGWDKENTSLLKRSTDGGATWTTVMNDVMQSSPGPRHQFFAQTLRTSSGSAMDAKKIYSVCTNQTSPGQVGGLYTFDLLVVSITLP